jgi:hypothetical protein
VVLAGATLTVVAPAIAGVQLVSVNPSGVAGNGSAGGPPSISADGGLVLFDSLATDLVAGDTNGYRDVFLRDVAASRTQIVSMAVDGSGANDRSTVPGVNAYALSADGRYALFNSQASNLTPYGTAGPFNASYAFVRDRTSGTTACVLADSSRKCQPATALAISGSGRYVVIGSDQSLSAVDLNSQSDIYVVDMQLGQVELISKAASGTAAGGCGLEASISSDGRFVAFSSAAAGIVPGDNNNRDDVFVRDRVAGTTERVSVASSGAEGNASTVAFAMSDDGRFTAFSSLASNLTSNDTNGTSDVFLRDRVAGTTTLLSQSLTGGVGDGQSSQVAISGDGRYVAFDSGANNLTAGDTNASGDVFLYTRSSGTLRQMSISDSGQQGNNTSINPQLSEDGSTLVFESWASNLTSTPIPTFEANVFVVPTSPDTSPPVTTDDAPDDWQNHDVTVHLHATDDRSGVAATYYTVDFGTQQTGNSVTLAAPFDRSNDGLHFIQYWSVDGAGNVETKHTVRVGIFARTFSGAGIPTAPFTVQRKDGSLAPFVGLATDATLGTDGVQQRTFPWWGGNMSWSPTKDRVVVSYPNPSTNTTNPYDLFVMNADGSNVHDITPTPNTNEDYPQWSPRGDKIAWMGGSGLVIGNVDGSGVRVVSASPAGHTFAFSPDGTQIAFSGPADARGCGIHIENVDGSNDHVLDTDCSQGPGLSPQWSPDGTRISFVGGYYPPWATHSLLGLFVMPVAGGPRAMITPIAERGAIAADPAPRWSPDGNWFLVSSLRPVTQKPDLALLSVDGDTFYRIPNANGDYRYGDWWDTPNATDNAPPITTADAPLGWVNHDVTIHFAASDDASGVKTTFFSVDGGPINQGSSVLVPAPPDHSNDGTHTISYYSVDNAGNVETAKLAAVNIDTTPPTLSADRTPLPNAAGWNNSAVTVTFSCADAGSGIASCPSPETFSEGAAQSAVGDATDQAGNVAEVRVDSINVDETAPALTGTATTSANASDWYSGDVTIHWTCDDALSGVGSSCPSDSAISGEGRGLSMSQNVTDAAGNTTAVASAPVNIDRTPPITTALAPTGWSNTGVTVTLSALDNLSGVDTTYYSLDGGQVQSGTSVAIASQGIHSLVYWSVDKAGNVEFQNTVQVLIDRSAPTITDSLDPAANGVGWNRTDVTVSFLCTDALSGVAFCTPTELITAEGAAMIVNGQARDNAGNTATDAVGVSIDKTDPTIEASADRPPNVNGWYSADVVVSFSCADALSGVATCSRPATLGEGASLSASGAAADLAGNTSSTSLSGINVDETAPTIAFAGNVGTYTVDQTVTITCSASDALSGIANSTCTTISSPAYTFGTGTTSRSAAATDRAGNTGVATASFTVTVTAASLDNLINQFFGGRTSGANGLIAKANAISAAANANARSGALGAFDNQVDAKLGNPLTAAQIALLKQLGSQL